MSQVLGIDVLDRTCSIAIKSVILVALIPGFWPELAFGCLDLLRQINNEGVK